MAVRLASSREHPLLDKTVHVFGYRAHVRASPQRFKKIPLGWERAYGGAGHDDNPAGTGATVVATLPNLVDPADPQRPAGFGPVARQWGPRRRLLGGVDPQQPRGRRRWSCRPGIDFRYFHAAPADQQIEYLHWRRVDRARRPCARRSPRKNARGSRGRAPRPGGSPRASSTAPRARTPSIWCSTR